MALTIANDNDPDSPIRVLVTPTQSSYFAGETLSVTITFSNTHSPDYPYSYVSPTAPASSYTHKRGSHSISSAPLARPPTSPGIPSKSVVVPSVGTRSSSSMLGGARGKPDGDMPSRKGLVGRLQRVDHGGEGSIATRQMKPMSTSKSDLLPELIEQRRKRLLAKSLSVSISPTELEKQLPEGTLAKATSPRSPALTGFGFSSSSMPAISEANNCLCQPSGSRSPSPPSPTTTMSPALETPSASVSVASSTAPSSPISSDISGSGYTQFMSTWQGQPLIGLGPPPKGSKFASDISAPPYMKPSYSHPVHQSQPHLPQHGYPYPYPYLQPRTASSISSPSFPILPHPKSELILYAYAQLTGSLVLLPMSAKQETQAMKKLRAKLTRRTVIGGGSMDITPSLHSPYLQSSASAGVAAAAAAGVVPDSGAGHHTRPTRPRIRATHARSPSLAAGFFSSLLSPTLPSSTSSSSPLTPSSPSSLPLSPESPRSASSSSTHRPSMSMSEVQWKPSIIDSDDTAAGIDPEVPLPMFDSQSTMLAVDLSLGPGESKSYIYSIKLPSVLPPTFKGRSIRFSYEFSVGVCRSASAPLPPPRALFPPPSLASGNGVSRVVKVPIRVYNNVAVGRVPRPYDLLWPVGRRIREKRAQGVVAEGGKDVAKVPDKEESLEEFREDVRRMLVPGIGHLDELEPPMGCREAVEILTRNPKKLSYDVDKDGVNVAVLTFTKSAYRLGETVMGVVEFNEKNGKARVLQMSAMLEAHEKLPSSLVPSMVPLKRVHAEQHQSFLMSVLRTTFSLDIPSDASPAFQVGVGEEDEDGVGGLEWRVRLCLLVAVASEEEAASGVFKGMVRDGPKGVWGSGWRGSASIVPMEKRRVDGGGGVRGWAYYLASTLLGPPSGAEEEEEEEEADYDGIRADPGGGVGEGVRYGGGEDGWVEAPVCMVECSVPVVVCAGNTAFKAVSVVFGV